MLEILQFACSGFWTFLGCFLLIGAVSGGIGRFATAVVVALKN
jgi:hypothetical protein